jgi:hypothetical protein
VPVPLFYVVYLVYLAVDRIVAGAEPVQGLYSLALAGLAWLAGPKKRELALGIALHFVPVLERA